MNINAPRGTADILPAESWKWHVVENHARQTAERYHFAEIRTPIFEHTELFHRGVGETSDVVSKETYTFIDRGDRSITLRPEGTAGVVRAMIESNLLAQEGARQKVFYIGPNFRYEKPQAGRLRQHHQFGVEAFGVGGPEQDVECILLQLDFYWRCGLKVQYLKINSLGDSESKARYREALVEYLRPYAEKLSQDSQRRMETNPLRILDSKDINDRDVCQKAPVAEAYLSDKSRKHLDQVQRLLEQAHPGLANYDGKLVRGFDYYTETLWEITAEGLGAQDAVGGGGRYDNLVEHLGGRPTPAVGFGSGLERLLLALESQGVKLSDPHNPLIWLISHGPTAVEYNWTLMRQLRSKFTCDMDLSARSVKAQLKMADREKAAICLIVGENELQAGEIILKNMTTGEQVTAPAGQVVERLAAVLASVGL